jgi:deoxyribonuclease V
MNKIKPREAILLQEKLRNKIIEKDSFAKIKIIAGADITLERDGNNGIAGVVVYSYPELKKIERVYCEGEIKFPYIPGLLSFREAPLIIKAFKGLKTKPDILILDGQGKAHPRRFGLACHVGLLLDLPTIGCAKSRLVGEYNEPGKAKWNASKLYDHKETIGMVLRTKTNVKPVYISVGHKISLNGAVKIIKQTTGQYRIPIPTRDAHIFVNELRLGKYEKGMR